MFNSRKKLHDEKIQIRPLDMELGSFCSMTHLVSLEIPTGDLLKSCLWLLYLEVMAIIFDGLEDRFLCPTSKTNPEVILTAALFD